MMFDVKHVSKEEVILRIDGPLSGESTVEFHSQMVELIAGSCKKITLDLSKTPAINSAAMGMIVRFNKNLNEQQRSFQIRGCSESLYSIFLMIKIDTLISIKKESELAPS